MSLTITRVVHASVLLDFNGEVILTDPWFSQKPGYLWGEPLGVTIGQLPKLAGVCVSHAHYDHFDMEAFSAYPDKEVPMVVKRGTSARAHKAGFRNVTELETWETARLGSVKVTAAPARHGVPENTYILESGGMTVFFGADTLLIPGLLEVAERFPEIDLALLPINGLRLKPAFNRQVVMSGADAARLCEILKPRIAIPIHYSFSGGPFVDRFLLGYDRRTGTPEKFKALADAHAPLTRIQVLPPGTAYTLPDSPHDAARKPVSA